MAPQSPNIPNSNNSNVDQSSSAFNFQIPPSVSGSIGALSSLYRSYGQFQQGNPVLGSLSFGASIPYLQQAFPNTFDPNSYQDQGSKDLINGLNKGGQFAQGGLRAYSLYSNLQQGNYLNAGLDAQKLTALGQQAGYIPDFTQAIQNSTGLTPVQYGDARSPTSGFAPYATAPIGAYNAAQNFKDGNYLGGTINAAQSIQASAQIYDTYFPAAKEISAQLSAQSSNSLGSLAVSPTGNGMQITSDGLSVVNGTAPTAGGQLATQTTDQVILANGSTATDIGTIGANTSNTGAGAAPATSDTLGQIGTGLTYLAAAYGAYDLTKMGLAGGDTHRSDTGANTVRGASGGAAIGTAVLPGLGTAVGAVLGAAYGAAIGLSSSSKGQRQVVRDKYREAIAKDPNVKLFGEDFKGTLADGTEVDFGKDKFSFDKGGSGDGNIDLSTKEGEDAAAFGDAIAAAQGLKGKGREAIATLFAGAALKNAKGKPEVVAQNMNHFMQQMGLDRAKTQALLNQNVVKGKISKDDYAAFSATLNRLAKGDKGGARQLSNEEIATIATEEEKAKDIKKLETEGPAGLLKPDSNLPIDFEDTDGRPSAGKRLPTAAEKEFKSTKGPFITPKGVTTTAPDGVNKITTYPDGTSMTTLIRVVKPSEKILGNLQAGKMPSTNLSKDDLKKLWTDAAKSGINFRRA